MAQANELAPVEKDLLAARVSFRVRENEREVVEAVAEEFGVSLSDAARMLLRQGIKNPPQLVA